MPIETDAPSTVEYVEQIAHRAMAYREEEAMALPEAAHAATADTFGADYHGFSAGDIATVGNGCYAALERWGGDGTLRADAADVILVEALTEAGSEASMADIACHGDDPITALFHTVVEHLLAETVYWHVTLQP
jgi:hypothetical protein